MVICNIFGNLVYVTMYFPHFGKKYQKRSGNPVGEMRGQKFLCVAETPSNI
jgi:hypothetical protein